MGLFDGADAQQGLERAQKRVKRLGDRELLDWMDVALPGMQRHLDEYRTTRDPAHLGEIGIAEMTFTAVLGELMERHLAAAEEGLTAES